jgi:hypothetical protein
MVSRALDPNAKLPIPTISSPLATGTPVAPIATGKSIPMIASNTDSSFLSD